jgi:hypothetical protein
MINWEQIHEIQQFITSVLQKRNCVVPLIWEKGGMAWNTVQFIHNDIQYHMFVSKRFENSFGFGISIYSSCKPLFSETIEYSIQYKQIIVTLLNQFF